jgi:oxygen-independent coproporphyrinogen-3 oxidase
MLENGLGTILDHIYQLFNMQCGIHLESHPNDLEAEKLKLIASLGVEHLSIGVEALQDHHLKTLSRPYSVKQVKEAVSRAVNNGFNCVNADFIFALPGQTYNEVEVAGKSLIDLGVDQVATYPLFKFPYTKWDQISKEKDYGGFNIYQRRKMLAILEGIFYGAGSQILFSDRTPLSWFGCQWKLLSQRCFLPQHIQRRRVYQDIRGWTDADCLIP